MYIQKRGECKISLGDTNQFGTKYHSPNYGVQLCGSPIAWKFTKNHSIALINIIYCNNKNNYIRAKISFNEKNVLRILEIPIRAICTLPKIVKILPNEMK